MLEQSGATVILTRSDENAIYDIDKKTLREKKVSDILSDWHVAPEKRCLLPVIQLLDEKAQRIKAILAGFLGYKDWIVKL